MRRLGFCGTALLLLVALPACSALDGSGPPGDPDGRQALRTALEAGSLDEGAEHAERIATEIRRQIGVELPRVRWAEDHGVSHNRCSGLPAYVRNPRFGPVSATGVPWDERNWTIAADVVHRVGADHGITEVDTILDHPHSRDLRITGPNGAAIDLGASERLSLTVTAGCRVPPDHRQRAEQQVQE